MPLKPQSVLIQCRQCGWKTTYAPPSDALLMPPSETCKQCGCAELDRQPAGVVASVLESISALVKRK